MYEDRLPQVQGWWLSDREYILKDKSTAFGNPDYRSFVSKHLVDCFDDSILKDRFVNGSGMAF